MSLLQIPELVTGPGCDIDVVTWESDGTWTNIWYLLSTFFTPGIVFHVLSMYIFT